MSEHLPSFNSKEFERILKNLGFSLFRQTGSNRIFVKNNLQIILPYHNKDLKKGTVHQMIKGTGLSIEEFKKHL